MLIRFFRPGCDEALFQQQADTNGPLKARTVRSNLSRVFAAAVPEEAIWAARQFFTDPFGFYMDICAKSIDAKVATAMKERQQAN